MREDVFGHLGAPAVRLAGFQLWVHGWESPDADDAWDGNWLNVTVHCGAGGGSVWASGAILDTASIRRFHDSLVDMHRTLAGEAIFESHEPNVRVRVSVADRIGHVRMRVEVTPDHLAQGHWFLFDVDQTYLPPVIAQCAALLDRYPVRHARERGV